jgi:hypothetical protein
MYTVTPWDEQTVVTPRGDLEKLRDALEGARNFLVLRDQMNAAVHCDSARWSPLTTVVGTAVDRVERLLKGV